MLKLFARFSISLFVFFLFAEKAVANDSDIVNCNHVWKIAVLGSSTAFGTGATTYDSSWVGKFTAYMKRKNSQNEVYNLGIPGFTTYQNLCPTGFTPPANRPSPDNSFNITAALATHADAIIINMPSNDAVNNYTIAEQQANYERAIHLADSAHIPVWITTTQPRNNMTAAQVSNLTTMRDWILTRVGDKAVDFWTTVSNGDGSIASFYDYDYAHVNNGGHDIFYKRIVAETILDSLCIRITPTLVAKAGNDISVTLPSTTTVLNGSASYSSGGGIITSYLWAKISGPANSVIISSSSATTNLTTLTEGRYSFKLTVTDNAQHTKSDTVNVIVSSRILIDFGPDVTTSPDANGKYWNNITETQPGIKLANAVTIGNLSTTIGLQVVNRIDGTFNVAGPGTNNGNTLGALNDYPATATSDFSFADPSATNGSWKITGLETTKQYTIKFWGTRSVADDRIIQIKRADQSIWQEYNATNNSNYNTSAIFIFSGKSEMSFDIKVKSGSAFGHICLIDITRTAPAVALNIPPVARANDVTVALPGTSGVLDGSASSDDDGSIVTYQWIQTAGPTTAQIVSPGSATTTVNNLAEGIYTFQFAVTDDSSATSTAIVNLTVNSRVLFDIGPDITANPDAGGKYWNSVIDGLPGVKIANAITTGNTTTGLSFEIVSRIDGTFNVSGPGTNNGNTVGAVSDYPASVTSDFAFAHPSTTTGSWKLSGLQTAKQYTIKFWGARSVVDERYIEIKRSDETTWQQYDAQNNTDYNNAAVFTFSGQTTMSFDIRVKDGDAFGYISLIDIKITNAPVNCTPSVTISSNQAGATCPGSSITFTAVAVNGGIAPAYQWKKNAVNISGATGVGYTTTALINNDLISCLLTVNTGCAAGTTALSNSVTTSILPIVPKAGNISGPTDVCPLIGTANNATYSIAPLANATTYTWIVPAGATIVSGQGTTSITVSYNSSFGSVDTISVVGGVCTNSSPTTLVVSKLIPAIPAAISGPVNACPYVGTSTQVTYSITAVANATSYTWTLPANVTLLSGQGTTSITVTFNSGFTTSSIKVKSVSNCSVSADRSLSITTTTSSKPGTITGPTNACVYIGSPDQATYTIRKVVNAGSYIWTVPTGSAITSHPGGAGVNDTIITVAFNNNFITGTNLSVQSSGCVPSAARTLTITSAGAPGTPGAISGPTNPCSFTGTATTATYTIKKMSTASSYIWTLPTGATAAHPAGTGGKDTIILVTYSASFSSGIISVLAVNGCGSSSTPKKLTVKNLVPTSTPTIQGPTDPCAWIGTTGATYTIKKIVNATSYTWTVPATGATATHPNGSGVNDTIIIVNYTSAFTTGNITARADANCGSSATRTFTLTRKLPSTPGSITTTLLSACPNRQYSYSISSMPANATSVTWTIPAGAAIVSGQGTTVIKVNYPQTVVSSSLTAAGTNNCGNSSSVSTITISLPACTAPRYGYYSERNSNTAKTTGDNISSGFEVKVMPNPTYNDFKFIVTSDDKKTAVNFYLTDVSGKIIETKTRIIPGTTISTGSGYAKGIYIGEFIQGDKHRILKLIKL